MLGTFFSRFFFCVFLLACVFLRAGRGRRNGRTTTSAGRSRSLLCTVSKEERRSTTATGRSAITVFCSTMASRLRPTKRLMGFARTRCGRWGGRRGGMKVVWRVGGIGMFLHNAVYACDVPVALLHLLACVVRTLQDPVMNQA